MSAVAADVFRARTRKRARYVQAGSRTFDELRRYYQTHIADFINDWGITVDPRNVRRHGAVIMPFKLDPRQREWVDWAYARWRAGEYGGTEKSRDVGLSWLVVAFSVSIAVLYDNIAVGLGSFKQDKVDRTGDMGSLFEKARAYIEGLPLEWRGGFELKRDSAQMRLLFPLRGSAITGEVGDNIGRGGRVTIYFVDEAAHLERDALVDASLSKTTDCRIDVSSVIGMTNTFAERMHDGKSEKFTFHWRDNPRFTQEDYDKFLEQWGPVITAQELDINYQASVEGIVIPSEWIQSSVDADKRLNIVVSGVRRGALDIADQGRDLNAFCARHGISVIECMAWSGKQRDVGDTAERAYQLCEDLNLDGFDYDADGGYGSGVRSEANRISERRRLGAIRPLRIAAFRGSGEVFNPDRKVPGTDVLAKDRFQNAKAQAYWWLSMLFYNTHQAVHGMPYDRDKLISLSSSIKALPKLCIELCQPQWKISSSGKLMVDKQPDGSASPNLADAVMIAFAPRGGPMRIDPRILE